MNYTKIRLYWRYKALDLKIKLLHNAWNLSNIPWRVIDKIDLKRAKGLDWSDRRAVPIMRRGFHAVDKEMARLRKLIPMAKLRSEYYLDYLLAKH